MSEERDAPAPTDGEDTGAVLAALQGDKTYLTDPDDKAPADAAEGEAPGDDAAAAADAEGEGEKPKPKQTAQDRIDELTKARREAERDAEYWKAKATQTDKPAEAKPEPKEDAEPDPAEYEFGETDPRFIKALGAYAAEQKFNELSAKAERQNQARTVEQSWTERQQAFAKDKPDYFEVLDRQWDCSEPMAEAIRTSEKGAEVAYHLASNPEEARRIAGLNPLAAIREIGRLEARFDTKASAPPVTASDAPPPPQQLRGNGGRFKVDPGTDSFADFEKAYVKGS
jgi:hypothetical protein